MKAIILYHPKSEHEGFVADYAREFKRYKGKDIELTSLETVEGAELARLYDITSYPALLLMSDDGSLQRLWQGLQLPLMDELSYYLHYTQPVISHTTRTIMPLAA